MTKIETTKQDATHDDAACKDLDAEREVTWPNDWQSVDARAALDAIEHRNTEVVTRYLSEAEHYDTRVIDALREREGDEGLNQILDLLGPKPLHAGAYNKHWKQAAETLERDYDVRLNRRSLPALAAYGLGPASSGVADVGRWAHENLFAAHQVPHYRQQFWPVPETYGAGSNVRFLVVGQPSPNVEWVVDQLNAFGCDVIGPKDTAARAINAAAADEYDAAYLDAAWFDTQTIVCVTDWLHDREVPYIIVPGEERKLPPIIEASGIVFRNIIVEDFRTAVKKCIPKELRSRVRLNARFALWNGEEIDPEAAKSRLLFAEAQPVELPDSEGVAPESDK